MQIAFFQDESQIDLLPLTYARPIYQLRIGIDRIYEKWNRFFAKYNPQSQSPTTLWVNGKFIPTENFVAEIVETCTPGSYCYNERQELIALHVSSDLSSTTFDISFCEQQQLKAIALHTEKQLAIRQLTDLFQLNGTCIQQDFEYIIRNKNRQQLKDPYTAVYGSDNLFIEEGANIKAAFINAEDGPIYIGKSAIIQEGSIIQQTHAICEGAVIQPGAKLRGDSTIGPVCKVGGEVSNSIFQSYSNKSHDGFLGNSLIGSWCNLGADTNTSNLKNNYSTVKQWSYRNKKMEQTNALFCGLVMGDHSKCGINTMFNTATVIGFSANIFGSGFPDKFIPSFTWGGVESITTFSLNKAMEVAERVMARRKLPFSEQEKAHFKRIFEATKVYRNWEK